MLTGHKAIYIPEYKIVAISDLHIGKPAHFRKSGIPVSNLVEQENYRRLEELLTIYPTEKLLILGDLFHSDENSETKSFFEWKNKYPSMSITLVLGNHDIYPLSWYKSKGIEAVYELKFRGIIFTHEPLKRRTRYFNIFGHIHPGINLNGGVRGYTRKIPCYYFIKNSALCMPGFGAFTGLGTIYPGKEEEIIGIINNRIFKIPD